MGILTTGLSTAARKKRADLVAGIKEALKKKGKMPTVSWNKLFTEIRDGSQIVCILICSMYVLTIGKGIVSIWALNHMFMFEKTLLDLMQIQQKKGQKSSNRLNICSRVFYNFESHG